MIYIPLRSKKMIFFLKKKFNETHVGSKRTRTSSFGFGYSYLLKQDVMTRDCSRVYYLNCWEVPWTNGLSGVQRERECGQWESTSHCDWPTRVRQCGWAVRNRPTSTVTEFWWEQFKGKLQVVKQTARVNIDILGMSELKWTGMNEFNSDDHYIYYYG